MNTAIVISAIVIVIYKIGKREINNIEKNIEEYAKKEKTKQQESKVLGQKPAKGTTNKKEKTNVRS